jgi:3-phenylpropionate/trans-cinnamate dioxygenase ferredoxin subunit
MDPEFQEETMSRWVAVAGESEVPKGGFKLVTVDGVDLALFNVDGKLCCIEDLCTHDGGNLVEGDFEGRVVTCPRHGAQFDVCTGEALTLPAVASTPVHNVRVTDGKIEIEVPGS